jgi:YVTN family beta-propeller protein
MPGPRAPGDDRGAATPRGSDAGAATTRAGPAPTPAAPRIFVGNEYDASVTVLDARTYRFVGTIVAANPPSSRPWRSVEGPRIVSTTLVGGRLSVIDTTAMEVVASVPAQAAPDAIALTNDGQQVWIANSAENSISILDLRRLRVLGTIATGTGPSGIAFSRDGRVAYVSHVGDHSVAVIELGSHRVVRRLKVGPDPQFLVRAPDGRIWGCNTGGDDVFIIDPESEGVARAVRVGSGPRQIAFGPHPGEPQPAAYVTVSNANKVSVIAGTRIVTDIPVGEGPGGIWADPTDTRVFVVHQGSNDLRVIDTVTAQVVAQVPVGWKPTWVFVSR